jgi:predicted amidohydrolase YtcJ
MIRIIPFVFALLISGCTMNMEKVDLLVKDALIYTVDAEFSTVEAFVVKDGRILDTGSSEEMEEKYKAASTLSMENHFIYPGWIDPHCHFTAYGLSLNQVDLSGTGSVEEIIDRCVKFAEANDPEWITGRGWDQNDWEEKEFPTRQMLDEAFPDTPVLLRRIDGHAGWANSKALELAGIDGETKIDGGEVLMADGLPTGILIDNGISLVRRIAPPPGAEETEIGLMMAQKNCFAVGLTSVNDAGTATKDIQIIDSLQQEGVLKMRINVMLDPSESNFTNYIQKGVIQNDYLTVGTLKLYADGALGSRGARMIEEYADDPGNKGLFVTAIDNLKALSKRAMENNYQVAVHCIGDDANRQMLKIFAELLEGKNDRRWRIEHAQIIHPDDFELFGLYSIIPSVQSTHATSDMYWAEDRIGPERIKGAYSYKTLLAQNGWLPNGSDFPVEHINPLYGFYAAVVRKDHSGYPEEGFRPEESLTREEALRSMTIWAAKSAFEEEFKGSLEKGKLADFVISKVDIMTASEDILPHIKVVYTYSGGEKVYEQ